MANKDIVQNVGAYVANCVTLALTIPITLPEWIVRENLEIAAKNRIVKNGY